MGLHEFNLEKPKPQSKSQPKHQALTKAFFTQFQPNHRSHSKPGPTVISYSWLTNFELWNFNKYKPKQDFHQNIHEIVFVLDFVVVARYIIYFLYGQIQNHPWLQWHNSWFTLVVGKSRLRPRGKKWSPLLLENHLNKQILLVVA